MTPFAQVDSAHSRKHQGTGLGLPICKALAELHGGGLTMKSEPGVGTTVAVRFPAERIERSTRDTKSGNPELQKQAGEELRNAGERFCKELLVRDRWTRGHKDAALSDYDGKTLGELGPKVSPCSRKIRLIRTDFMPFGITLIRPSTMTESRMTTLLKSRLAISSI